jgi:large subunit ribosomal protein L9
VVCRLRVGEEGRVFGAVTNEDIARALQAQHGVEVDRRRIDLHEPIKQLGEHAVTLRLHRDVVAQVNLIVTQDR